MGEHTIPTSIDEITAEWIQEVTGFEVESVGHEQIGAGIGVSSALYRLSLHGPNCPQTMIAKLPAIAEEAVFTSTMLRMYIREVAFFRELAKDSPVRVPVAYHCDVDDNSAFVVLMEDLGSLRLVDQLAGMALTDAETAVDRLGDWHATWWGQGDALADRGLVVSLADPIYPAILPMVFAEGWEKVTSELDIAPGIHAVGPRWVEAFPALLSALAGGVNTMAHGDYRADNILFDAHHDVALLDFQLTGAASGAYDLAYFVTQSLDVDIARSNERTLFDRWFDRLVAAGVDPLPDRDEEWLQYRRSALFCLVYPIVASRGMDLDDPRQRHLIECMNSRFARAIDDLDLTELL